MLVLNRKANNSLDDPALFELVLFTSDGPIRVKVLSVSGEYQKAMIGIDAPESVKVLRREVAERQGEIEPMTEQERALSVKAAG